MLTKIEEILSNPRLFKPGFKPDYIVTPNPEQITLAQKDLKYRDFLNNAVVKIPDGIGLSAAAKFLSLPNPKNKLIRLPIILCQGLIVGISLIVKPDWVKKKLEIIHGRDITYDVVKLASEKKWRVVIISGTVNGVDVAAGSVEKLKRDYPKAIYKNINAPIYNEYAKPQNSDKTLDRLIIRRINVFKPHILFVGMTPPKQERWLMKHLNELNVGIASAVGGTFAYISGAVSNPPKWMTKFELEWLWRLVSQKGRVKRVLTAFPMFPLRVFWAKLTS